MGDLCWIETAVIVCITCVIIFKTHILQPQQPEGRFSVTKHTLMGIVFLQYWNLDCCKFWLALREKNKQWFGDINV